MNNDFLLHKSCNIVLLKWHTCATIARCDKNQ